MKNYREVAESVFERRNAYQKKKKRRRNIVIQAAAGGGGLCLLALLGFGISGNGSLSPDSTGIPASHGDVYYVSDSDPGDDRSTGSADGAEDNNDSESVTSANGISRDDLATSTENIRNDKAAVSAENTDSDDQPTALGQGSAAEGILPVSYSSLSLPQGQVRPDILSAYAGSSQSISDILPFSEEMLSESCAILEGQITDMYLKHYHYDTYDDKFGPKEVYHNRTSSVVYELTVDKVWYGDQSLAGTSVLIEDDIYLIDSYFSLKVGCSYVIPVSDLEKEKRIWEEYAGGDLTRDGRYTTLYPHHPQIEVTVDGDYIVTTDWETLCQTDARDIQLDIPENSFVEYHPENSAGENGLITTEWRTLLISPYDMVYYYDKLKLIGADEFFVGLNRLIERLP